MGPGEPQEEDLNHTSDMSNHEDGRRFGMTKLGEGNYHIWKQRTELWLRRENLWDHITTPPPDPLTDLWKARDSQTKATIGLLVEDKFLVDIRSQHTAKETWERLKSVHQQTSLGARLALYRRIFTTKYIPNTNMSDHITSILDSVRKLEDSGHHLEEELVCTALMGSLPKDYDVLITTIEGRESKNIEVDYVREKIIEESKKKNTEASGSGHEVKAMPMQSSRRNWYPKKTVSCYYCHKVGHIRRDCRLLANHEAHREHQKPDPKESHNASAKLSTARTPDRDTFSIMQPTNHGHRAMTCSHRDRNTPQPRWIIDTGASDHMCRDAGILHGVQKITKPITIVTADGKECLATHKGTFKFTALSHEGKRHNINLHHVLVIETLTDNLISVSRLEQQGYGVTFKARKCTLSTPDSSIHLGDLTNNLYTWTEDHSHINQRVVNCIHNWHYKLGHRNIADISRMNREEMVNGMHISTCPSEGECSHCILAKKSNAPFKKLTLPRSQRPFEVLHSDLCGPITPTSLGGNKYSLSIIDDFSGFCTIYMIPTKDQTISRVREFIEQGINYHQRRPRAFISDGGGEFCNKESKIYFKDKGIQHVVTIPYSPQENGKSERHNRTLMESTRALLKQTKLPQSLWGEMALTSTYLINRVCHHDKTQTPYEMWHGRKPSLHHLKTIGNICYYYNNKPHKRKLEDRAIEGIMVGYGTSDHFYRIWDPINNLVHISRAVTFPEEKCPLTQENFIPEPEYLGELPPTTELETISAPQEEERTPIIRRSSSRSNQGKAPQILTYNENQQPGYQPQNWYDTHHYHRNDPPETTDIKGEY